MSGFTGKTCSDGKFYTVIIMVTKITCNSSNQSCFCKNHLSGCAERRQYCSVQNYSTYCNFNVMLISVFQNEVLHCFRISDVDECSATPCKNDGVCTNLVNDYSCKCTARFEGKDCSNGTCNNQ